MTILYIILAVLAFLVIVSLFLPSKVHVERSTTMNAGADQIFEQINELKNWPNWMPWYKIDPNMKLNYGDQSSGQGASYSWESPHRKVGSGKVTIVETSPPNSLKTRLDFKGQKPGYGSWDLVESDGGTKVTWGMDADMGSNPIGKFFGLMFDKMLGPQFEEGLQAMKEVVESGEKIED